MIGASRFLIGFLSLSAIAASAGIAAAEVSPLMGVWVGVANTGFGPVQFKQVMTADSAVTRQSVFPSGFILTTWGFYEVVGAQLHIVWRGWSPRDANPLNEDCLMQFEGPDKFDCAGTIFTRTQ